MAETRYPDLCFLLKSAARLKKHLWNAWSRRMLVMLRGALLCLAAVLTPGCSWGTCQQPGLWWWTEQKPASMKRYSRFFAGNKLPLILLCHYFFSTVIISQTLSTTFQPQGDSNCYKFLGKYSPIYMSTQGNQEWNETEEGILCSKRCTATVHYSSGSGNCCMMSICSSQQSHCQHHPSGSDISSFPQDWEVWIFILFVWPKGKN